jgi:hypothetical protein
VATKAAAGAGLYRAPARLRPEVVNVLQRIARVPPIVTDGAFAPDGRGFVLRDYQEAFVYTAPGRRAGSFELPLQFQGESIAVSPDGRSVLVGSEGADSEVWRVPLPASILARVAPPTTGARAGEAPGSAGSPGAGGGRWGAAPFLAMTAGGLALVLGVLLGRRRR